MGKLSKPQQQFILLFTGTALGSFVGYLINQLPNIPDFPNKNQIVIGCVTLLTLISFFVAWNLARLDGEGSVDKPEEYAVQQSREKLLERLRKTWISGVLEKSLYHEARVELVLKEVQDQRQETLPPGTRVIQKFDELGQGGTILILGEPGSGKTTTLLELARDLLERAEQDADAPLPVVLHLAAWNRSDRMKSGWSWFGESKPEPQKFKDWVLEELKNSPVIEGLTGEYRDYRVPGAVAQSWLDEQRVVLLLDGLDEVVPEQREGCVKAIYEFRQAYSLVEMVVCCRVKDYRKLNANLQFQQELMIQPLTWQQIENSLEKTTGNLSAIKNILPNEILQGIANCPFTLWILSRAYKDDSAGRLPSIPPDERIKFLLDLYICQQLKPPKEYIRYQREGIRFPNFQNQQEAQLIWIKL
jgi:GTPase SAR1 family protein